MSRFNRFLDVFFVIFGYWLQVIAKNQKDVFAEYDPFVHDAYYHFCNVLIAVGILMFVFSFLSAYAFSTLGLTCASCTLFASGIIFLLASSAGIGGIALERNGKVWLDVRLNNALINYGNNSEISIKFDSVQTQMKCCGINNYTDWSNLKLPIMVGKDNQLPLSCCLIPHATFDHFYCNSTSPTLYKVGCFESFGSYIKANTDFILYGGFVAAAFQLVRVLWSIYLVVSPSARNEGYEEM